MKTNYIAYNQAMIWGEGDTVTAALRDAENTIDKINAGPDPRDKITAAHVDQYWTRTEDADVDASDFASEDVIWRFRDGHLIVRHKARRA